MTHTYHISGMTCNGCVAGVKSALLKMPDILSAEVELPGTATIQMQRHVSLAALQQSIGSKYTITEDTHHTPAAAEEARKSWLQTYKPLLLVFAFITGISGITAFHHGGFHLMQWMNSFMAGFFLTFSFFKLLDVQGFADSYRSYDLLAKKLPAYGFIYPFIELALGLAYLSGIDPVLTNVVTIVVMGFSSAGVIQSLANKRKIQCACLGAVFNLPMSSVTIIEDLLMVVMAAAMLFIA